MQRPFSVPSWIRAVEVGTWAVTGLALFLGLDLREVHPHNLTLAWSAAFLAAGAGLGWLASPTAAEARKGPWLCGLVLATFGVLAMVAVAPSYLAGLLLLFTAWHGAQRLPLAFAFLWVALQTALLGLCFLPLCPKSQWHLSTAIYGGMQAFVVLLAHLFASQEQSRIEMLRANAELQATQDLLDCQARAAERLHLAREIHDVMGHTLTALLLRLEVASHQEGEATKESVQGAKSLARELLTEVRHIVSASREEPLDISASLDLLTASILRPKVHLELGTDLRLRDPRKAQALLRCVQELITNAIRHGDAENLWIALRLEGDRVVMEAKDDGVGAEEVVEGYGLKGIRERLELLGGALQGVGGSPGFSASLWLPAEE